MREVYQIFFDSKAGLIPGALRLSQNGGVSSGELEMFGNPLTLSDVQFDGNRRRFQGSLNLDDQLLNFRAEGELEDDVLDIMVQGAGRKMLWTGFLQKETEA